MSSMHVMRTSNSSDFYIKFDVNRVRTVCVLILVVSQESCGKKLGGRTTTQKTVKRLKHNWMLFFPK